MSPADYLALCLCITAAAVTAQWARRRRETWNLRTLARQWDLHYSAADRLGLASRVVDRLDVPGASDVRLLDLLYRTDRTHHRYLFTAEYGVGVVRGKTRRRRVVAMSEPVHRGGPAHGPADVWLAPEGQSLDEQYRLLHAQLFTPAAETIHA